MLTGLAVVGGLLLGLWFLSPALLVIWDVMTGNVSVRKRHALRRVDARFNYRTAIPWIVALLLPFVIFIDLRIGIVFCVLMTGVLGFGAIRSMVGDIQGARHSRRFQQPKISFERSDDAAEDEGNEPAVVRTQRELWWARRSKSMRFSRFGHWL